MHVRVCVCVCVCVQCMCVCVCVGAHAQVHDREREGWGIKYIIAKDVLLIMAHTHVMSHDYKSRERNGNQNYNI